MIKSASQLKGKIKNLANGDVRKAETYIRLYFMERLLERISISDYKERFRNKNEFAKGLEWEIVSTQVADSIRKVLK